MQKSFRTYCSYTPRIYAICIDWKSSIPANSILSVSACPSNDLKQYSTAEQKRLLTMEFNDTEAGPSNSHIRYHSALAEVPT